MLPLPAGDARLARKVREGASCPVPHLAPSVERYPQDMLQDDVQADGQELASGFSVNFITLAVQCTCGENLHVSGMWPDIVNVVQCACGREWSVDIGVSAC
jgi:hypothetical protein